MDFYDILLAKKLNGSGGGSDIDVVSLSVSANGVYSAPTGKAYDPVNVSVPTGVFPSGTLSITSNSIYNITSYASVDVNVSGLVPTGTSSITQNGIYDITSYASVDVNVSSGGEDYSAEIIERTISSITNNAISIIGSYAFAECHNLVSASFGNVSVINGYAFAGCNNLSNVSFPNASVIGYSAFSGCRLTNTNFPSVTSIGVSAFTNLGNYCSLYFPMLSSCGTHAFYNCQRLMYVDLGNLSIIPSYCFEMNYYLSSFNAPSVGIVEASAFSGASIQSVNHPILSALHSNAFGYCGKLSIFSSPLAYIGSSAFYRCTKLGEVYLTGSSLCSLQNANAFISTPMALSSYLGHFGSIYVPASLVDSYKTATNWVTYSNRITSYVS